MFNPFSFLSTKSNKSKARLQMLKLFATGMAMGSADVVPGVSGGTMALIFGVYERLIQSIKTVSGQSLKLFLKGKFKESILSVPWEFLLPLLFGLFTAIITMANAISWMLVNQPVIIWSFFFGLVAASVLVLAKKVKVWSLGCLVGFLTGGIGTYLLVAAVPVATPNTYLAMFVSGAIAIVAMILPGISGSFLLLLMGKYAQVLEAVTNRDILTLAVFMLGAVVGLALFSRVLSWLFANYHDLVMATLTGVLLGSLRKLWPWKEVLTTTLDRHGDMVPLSEANVIPTVVDLNVLIAVVFCCVGLGLILYLSRFDARKHK